VKRTVLVLPAARIDIHRLADFLVEKNPRAAEAATGAIVAALRTLSEFAERGRNTDRADVRELLVDYGRDGYVNRYQVDEKRVLITNVFHGRERR